MKLPFLPADINTESPLYERALTLANHRKKALYERLEFLGDRVLGLIVAEMLYRHFKNEQEGDWAMRFTLLVREETLAEVAKKIGLPAYLITEDNSMRENQSVLSDVMEALIAAIYLDQGIVKAKKFVENLWMPLLNRDHETIKDAKSALQEWSQSKVGILPEYELIERTGPDHAPHFRVKVSIEGYGSQIGEGGSKKEATQVAAEKLLSALPKEKKQKKSHYTGNHGVK